MHRISWKETLNSTVLRFTKICSNWHVGLPNFTDHWSSDSQTFLTTTWNWKLHWPSDSNRNSTLLQQCYVILCIIGQNMSFNGMYLPSIKVNASQTLALRTHQHGTKYRTEDIISSSDASEFLLYRTALPLVLPTQDRQISGYRGLPLPTSLPVLHLLAILPFDTQQSAAPRHRSINRK